MICEGSCSINDIPTIRVCMNDGHYVTSDNRRLWVFRQLERLGRCTTIPVRLIHFILPAKLTSTNGGLEVRVRGATPGGSWYRKAARGTSRYVSSNDIFFDDLNSYGSSRPSTSSYSSSHRNTTYPSPISSPRSSFNDGYSFTGGSNQSGNWNNYSYEQPKKDDGWWCTIL